MAEKSVKQYEEEIADLEQQLSEARLRVQILEKKKELKPELEEYYQIVDSILEYVPDALFAADLDFRFHFWSRSAEKMFGFSRDEAIDAKADDLLPPNDESVSFGNIKKVVVARGSWIGELRLTTKRGIPLIIEGIIRLLRDKNGDIKSMFGIFRDITARKSQEASIKRSEKRFKTLFENVPIGIVISDPEKDKGEAEIGYPNKKICDMLGYERDELHGMPVSDITHPDDFANQLKLVKPLGKGEADSFEMEKRYFKKDGSVIWVSLISGMLKDEYGKIVERYAFIRDISDEKEAEAEIEKHIAELEKRQKIIERYADQLASLNKKLQSSEMELRELNASKDKFFSIIAHDLRNPFQALIGMTNMLRTGYELFTEEELLEQIGVIESAAENTLQLIENLLQWARAQTGRIQFEPQEFELVVVAGENVYLIDEAAKQKNITVKNDVPDGLVTFADRNMVTTIIRNLITNAVKFTHKGGCITVSAAEKDGLIEVCVEDNGIGMEDNVKNELFRIDKHQTTKGTENEKGTGLGLILCKEFVEKHGGNIWVESTKGKGSKFFFSLPVNNQAASNENLLHSVD